MTDKKSVRVSDISLYMRCPRQVYYINKGNSFSRKQEYAEHLVLKELALVYPEAAGKEDIPGYLNEELTRIERDIAVIRRDELSSMENGAVEAAVSKTRELIGVIGGRLAQNKEAYAGFGHVETEPILYSTRFDLAGSPERLITSDGSIIPSVIKTGNAPENGIWKNDRVQLAAYAILIEESRGTVVKRGFVEYARSGDVRETAIRHNDRRKVLLIMNKIKKIQDGIMPEKPDDAPCGFCDFVGICDVKTTLASRFF